MTEENRNNESEEKDPKGKVPQEEVPAFLLDDPPPIEKKGDYTKWALMHGVTEEELEEQGFNRRSISICAQELEKEKYRVRPKKPPASTKLLPPGEKSVHITAKGLSPEGLIEGISIPVEDGEGPIFEKGMKFGMTVLTLGVRVAQELSNMGVQQARPLVEMARDMRSGEAAAAKSAAGEAAMLAAGAVQQSMSPLLAQIAEQNRTSGPDPVKGMMVRTMEPLMKNLMGRMLPGMGKQEQGPPEGWVRKTE